MSQKKILQVFLKGVLMQIWNVPISSSLYENNMLKISHLKIFYFLSYAHVRYMKSLITNIQKQ